MEEPGRVSGAVWEQAASTVTMTPGYSFGLLGSRIPKPNLSKRRTTLLLLMLQRVGRGRRREGETVTEDSSHEATALPKELKRVCFCSCITSDHPRDAQVIQQQTHEVIHANLFSGKELHNLICPKGGAGSFPRSLPWVEA